MPIFIKLRELKAVYVCTIVSVLCSIEWSLVHSLMDSVHKYSVQYMCWESSSVPCDLCR